MGERNAENADLAVEELKRKARRRLVGAIVLALAAAIILPLLLEREPKPLGDDVSVKIPPVDEGKFVNRLTGRASETKSTAKAAPKNETKGEPAAESKSDTAAPGSSAAVAPPPPNAASAAQAPATTVVAPVPAPSDVAPPKKSVSQAEQRVLSPATKPAPKADAAAPPPPKADATPVTPAPPSTTSAAAAPSPALATVSPPTPAKTEPDAVNPTKVEGFAVQIAAFTDDKGANALAGKLKKAGFASTYIEPVQTSRGTLWRVRVGGYSARAEADAARTKLKADGWNGIVVMAK
jgi:DedD protein